MDSLLLGHLTNQKLKNRLIYRVIRVTKMDNKFPKVEKETVPEKSQSLDFEL